MLIALHSMHCRSKNVGSAQQDFGPKWMFLDFVDHVGNKRFDVPHKSGECPTPLPWVLLGWIVLHVCLNSLSLIMDFKMRPWSSGTLPQCYPDGHGHPAMACLYRQGHRQIFDGTVLTDRAIVNLGMAHPIGWVIVKTMVLPKGWTIADF